MFLFVGGLLAYSILQQISLARLLTYVRLIGRKVVTRGVGEEDCGCGKKTWYRSVGFYLTLLLCSLMFLIGCSGIWIIMMVIQWEVHIRSWHLQCLTQLRQQKTLSGINRFSWRLPLSSGVCWRTDYQLESTFRGVVFFRPRTLCVYQDAAMLSRHPICFFIVTFLVLYGSISGVG